jgi:hypothetical protein
VRKPGQAPGLSVFSEPARAVSRGEKAQVIDLDLLESPLTGIPDRIGIEGAIAEHLALTPIRPDGQVDQGLLEEWARTRTTNQVHWLTELIKKAHVGSVKRQG